MLKDQHELDWNRVQLFYTFGKWNWLDMLKHKKMQPICAEFEKMTEITK